MMIIIKFLFTIGLLFISSDLVYAKKNVVKVSEKTDLDSLYRESQRAFNKKEYKKALPLLERYLTLSREHKHKRERLFWVIDQIGRIYLRVERNPSKAIKFFDSVSLYNDKLNEAEEDDISAWVSASKDWKKYGTKNPSKLKGVKLFNIGKEFFDYGKKRMDFPLDDSGNAFFSVASVYLIPFIIQNDRSHLISEALLMMGEIRLLLRLILNTGMIIFI